MSTLAAVLDVLRSVQGFARNPIAVIEVGGDEIADEGLCQGINAHF